MRVIKLFELALEIVAGAALFLMMCLTFADVIGRYGFHHSIFGTSEIIEFLMAVSVFAGVAFTAIDNEHITITIFEGWIEKNVPFLQRYVIHAFTLIIFAGISYQLWATCLESFSSGKRTAVLDLPYWIIPGAEAALSSVGTILFAATLVRTRGKMRSALERGHLEES